MAATVLTIRPGELCDLQSLVFPPCPAILAPGMSSKGTLNFGVVGCGGVTLQNHLPGLALCPEVKVVALCVADAATLERARQQTGVPVTRTRHEDIEIGRASCSERG